MDDEACEIRCSVPIHVAFRFFVELEPQPCETRADPAANDRRILSDAAAKDERVDTAEHGSVRAEVLMGPVAGGGSFLGIGSRRIKCQAYNLYATLESTLLIGPSPDLPPRRSRW